VDELASVNWVAQCTNPVAPLPPDLVTEGLGSADRSAGSRQDPRLAYFDCSQSWLYPPGDGWYVLAREYAQGRDMRRTHLQQARLAFEQTRPGSAPPFQVYEWFDQDPLAGLTPEPVRAAPSAWPPAQAIAEGLSLTPPVQLGDRLSFLGFVAETNTAHPGDQVAIQTYWRVSSPQPPILHPISLMAHLLDANGAPIAVGDGLGVPIDQWRPGDIIVQRHVFEVLPQTAPGAYWVQVGAYTLPDVQRLPVLREGAVVGDRLLIGQIEVVTP